MEDRRASFKPWIRREHEVETGSELRVDLYPWNRKVDLQIFSVSFPLSDFYCFGFADVVSTHEQLLVGRSYGAGRVAPGNSVGDGQG